ncbi:ATP phosphoribosyltransferase regulatory subunit [Amphibacillus sp. Q70]|uniref:ATP phosphoribosyltransferase regulatory subunit n=1 Tax=Amphibacillus sp. Q70 TaxID=3453416 RepID=UPI003F876BCB
MFLPAGSQDKMGEKLNHQAKVNRIFRKVVQQRNYKAIETPVVEYAQTFTNPHVGMAFNKLLKWFDREGNIEVLRADWTTAIARALLTKNPSHFKWFYQGSVFQNNVNGIESQQAGIEIIRTDLLLGEMETLFTAVDVLEALSIEGYVIELGHTGIFDDMVQPLGLNVEEEEQLRVAMNDKQEDVVYQMAMKKGSKQIANRLIELIQAYGNKEILTEYRRHWEHSEELVEIINHLEQLMTSLEQLGVQDVIVDLGSVRKLRYYSGTMFSGYLKKTGAICFSGGRYDRLYAQFDKDISAVGLAFYVDVLTSVIAAEPKKAQVCLLASPKTHVKAEQMRINFPNAQVDILYQLPKEHRYDEIINVQDEVEP